MRAKVSPPAAPRLAEAISHELPRPKTPKEVLEELERERAEREAAAAKEE